MGKMRKIIAGLAAMVLLFSCVQMARAASYPFVKITTEATPLYSEAVADAAVLVEIPTGKALLVTGEKGNFYVAQYDNYTGYLAMFPGSVSLPEQEDEPTPTYETLKNGSRGDDVKKLQQALKELGFYTSTVDGKYGSGTVSAVRSFQKMNSLSATGTADLATQMLLYQGQPKNVSGVILGSQNTPVYQPLSRGMKGQAVKDLQRRLQQLGYYDGKIDGDFGTGTYNAVRAFQKKAGVSQTGIADHNTQLLLYADTAPSNLATPTPAPTPKATATPALTGGYPYTTYTTASVNFRKKATINSDRITTVPKGADVMILADAGDFVQATYRGKTGYLMRDYVYIPDMYIPGDTLETDNQAQKDYIILHQDNRGAGVKALQEALQELGFYTGTVDGSFGQGTVNALKSFQKKNSLRQDGVATPEVQKLIFEGKPINSKGKKMYIKTLPPIENYPMQLNDRGDAVTALQKKLNLLGYFTASYTNVYNSATQKAVRAFQQDHALTVDGKAGEKTLRLLNLLAVTPAPNPTVEPQNTPLTEDNVIVMQNGTRGRAVIRLQERLMELGYYTCEADGIYDSNEITTVRVFQKRNGLKADGIAGLETQLKLYSMYAVPAEDANIVLPTPVPFTTPDVTVTLRTGSQGQYVRLLQERLTVLGYYDGAVDGDYGSGTLRAVVTFQSFHGLNADGVAGKQTQQLLYSNNARSYADAKPTPAPTKKPTATQKPGQNTNTNITVSLLKTGSRGEAVRKLQQRLVQLGYLAVADGEYGPKTYSAVRSFQKKNGLSADGIAGTLTQNRLYSASAIAANGGTVTPPASDNAGSTGGSLSGGTGSFRVPNASEVRYANWFTEIRARARLMPDVVIYDPETGLHYNLHMFSFGKHADAEPPTKQDVETMVQIIGEDDWGPKYVWVIFSDGRVYIGSTHSKGHTVDHNSQNGLTGHICLHFPRIMSEAEATGPYAVSHQKEILWGWEVTQALIR